jgi:hypothetical protein
MEAGRLLDAHSPRAAVDDCFSRFADTAIFGAGDKVTQERFLFEYMDASLKASATPLLHQKYLALSVDVGKKYVDWYQEAEKVPEVLPTANQRVRIVVFATGDSMIELGKISDFLDWYDALADAHPLYFAHASSVKNWNKALRFDPETQEPMTDQQVRSRLKADQAFVDDWWILHSVLERLKNIPETKREATRLLQTIAALNLPTQPNEGH